MKVFQCSAYLLTHFPFLVLKRYTLISLSICQYILAIEIYFRIVSINVMDFQLALECLQSSLGIDLKAAEVEVAGVTKDNRKFRCAVENLTNCSGKLTRV